MKKSIFQTILAIVILLIISPVKANTILVLGDSISAAFGIDPEEGWVYLLKEKLKKADYNDYTVINASVSGNTTGDGLSRLPALLEKYKPTIVIIELGGNDGLRGYPVKLVQRNLQKIINQSQQSGARILLAGIEIPPNYGQRYTDSFRKTFKTVAEKNDVAFLPFILKNIATNTDLMQKDLIHPTAEAQRILLNTVWDYLQPLVDNSY